jgi:hypothetical protein
MLQANNATSCEQANLQVAVMAKMSTVVATWAFSRCGHVCRWMWKVKDADGDEVVAQPLNLSQDDFCRQLALMFDGKTPA